MKLKYTKTELKDFFLTILAVAFCVTILCGITVGICLLFRTQIDGFIVSMLEKIPPNFLPQIETEPQPFFKSFFGDLIGYLLIPLFFEFLQFFVFTNTNEKKENN